jgi:hypothetical protein
MWTSAACQKPLGFARPRLLTGRVRSAERVLPWSTAPDLPSASRQEVARTEAAKGDLVERVWAIEPCSTQTALAANDRRFSLRLAQKLSIALEGHALLGDIESVESHIARQGDTTEWVLKHALSAAGRRRVFGRGRTLDEHARRALPRLLADGRGLLFEPWRERTDDYACCGLIDDHGHRLVACYRQHADWRGRFYGITIGRKTKADLEAGLGSKLSGTARDVARALGELGYRGVFSVDAWRYRDADRGSKINLLGEINARVGFGLLAFVAARRAFDCHEWANHCTLRLGDALAYFDATAPRKLPLLLPASDDKSAAWLELTP